MSLPSVPDGAVGILPLSYFRTFSMLRTASVSAGGSEFVEFLPINEEWVIQNISYLMDNIPGSTGNVLVDLSALQITAGSRVTMSSVEYVGSAFIGFNNFPLTTAIVSMMPRTDEGNILSIRNTIISSNDLLNNFVRITYHNNTNLAMTGNRRYVLTVKASPIIGPIAHG